MAHYTKVETQELSEIAKVEEGPKYIKLVDRFAKRTKRNRNAVLSKIQRIRLKEQFSEMEHYDVPMDENEERMLNYEREKAEIKNLVEKIAANKMSFDKSSTPPIFHDIHISDNVARITIFNGGFTCHFE
jgi:hypothetical protein